MLHSLRSAPRIDSKSCSALLLAFTCLLFGACATPKHNYQAEATRISQPALNTEATAYVGDEMLKQGKFYERDAIKLAEPLKFGGLMTAYTLSPGYYIKTGEDKKSEFYLPAEGRDAGSVTKALLVDPWQSIQLYKDKPRICVVTVFNLHVCEEAKGVTRTKRLSLSDDSFQQTLIYSGRVGNKINIGYREFSNSMARPAFNNDVEYDLNESKIIGYKGARLEVIEATNQFIRYRVLQNFNQAEF